MAEPTTGQTSGPLELYESGAAGYCDPAAGLCALPAAVPELRGDPETRILPDLAENVVPGFRPIVDWLKEEGIDATATGDSGRRGGPRYGGGHRRR